MGNFSFSEIKNDALNDFESEKCQLNYNSVAKHGDEIKAFQSKSKSHQKRKCRYGTVLLTMSGLILFSMGFFLAKYTFTDMLLTERIKMRPWFIAYGLWLNPEPEAAASVVNEYNYFMQIGYNFLHRRYSYGLFINITVYDYLWNYRSELLEKAWELVPSMIPLLNSGVLHIIYASGPDRYNVKIGTQYGDSQFFQIKTINGAPTVPGYNLKMGDCYASVENSTEGAMYRQRVTKDDVLTFWRKALCRKVDLHFEKELKIHDILRYKYTLGPDVYDRKLNNETDCYKGVYGELPNGLTDVSKCYFDFPLAESQPHFYGRSEGFTKKLQGLNANVENHSSFAIIEPKLGFPMKQAARSQMNLVIPKFSSFFEKDYQLFSDMILPAFWVEFLLEDLPSEIVF